MNYKLAKELKDAGFPMKLALPNSESVWGGVDTNGTYYQYLTLSEFIQACGEKFHCLVYTSDKKFWSAGTTNVVKDWQNGKSPEEAVAKLWLKLNEKHEKN